MIQSITGFTKRFITDNHTLQILGGSYLMLRDSILQMIRKPIPYHLVIEQVYQIGLKSLPLVIICVLSIGMVMALQFGISLEKFGGKIYVPKIVSLSIIRELGPVFSCIMIAARIGSGITSEIGSMVVTEQLDAMRALGTSPIRRIALPRILGCFIAVPILAVIANTVGVLGGLIVGVNDLGLDPLFYMEKVYTTIRIPDYITGIVKTIFFSFMISVPACYLGFNVKGGTKGVGRATTQSVVFASIAIMIGDYILTKALWIIEQWIQ
jgi:phospholipid/cholesterol/gamma-HCH transport system permease protein